MPMDQNTLTLSEEDMRKLGYQMIDAIVAHHKTQHEKRPLALASREEMDSLFLEEAPEKPSNANEVLKFVVEKVLTRSTLLSHPKSYAFVPGPSNYVSVIGDALATGYNIFSGSWVTSPAAAELEIVTMVTATVWPSKEKRGWYFHQRGIHGQFNRSGHCQKH